VLTGLYSTPIFSLGKPRQVSVWVAQLEGSDENLDNNHLMRMAGRWLVDCVHTPVPHNIPVVDCDTKRAQE